MRLATNQGTLFLKIYKSARNQKAPAQLDLQRIAFTHTVQDFYMRKVFLFLAYCRIIAEKRSAYVTALWKQGKYMPSLNSLRDLTTMLRTRSSYVHRGKCLDVYTSSCAYFNLKFQLAGPSLETELFIQLEARLSRLQLVAEKDPSAPTQIDSWIDEVGILKNAVSTVHDAESEQGWLIHGDYRAQNLKFDGSGIHAILDLDTACPGSPPV